jgi:hypothetical protein
MRAVSTLSNQQLERHYLRYIKAGLPVPIDIQGELIRRGYILKKESC